jgi:hypothetical protein
MQLSVSGNCGGLGGTQSVLLEYCIRGQACIAQHNVVRKMEPVQQHPTNQWYQTLQIRCL